MILIGERTSGAGRTIILLMPDDEDPKSGYVRCHGAKRHYRKDGSCVHTDSVIAQKQPDAEIRLDPFGGQS